MRDQINIRLPRPLLERLRRALQVTGKTQTQALIEALEDYCDKYGVPLSSTDPRQWERGDDGRLKRTIDDELEAEDDE